MAHRGHPDLAGVYISSSFVDVLCGLDLEPEVRSSRDIKISWYDADEVEWRPERIHLDQFSNPGDVFAAIADQILQLCPNVNAICVGVYGPFETRDASHSNYGQLVGDGMGRLFEGCNIRKELEGAIAKLTSNHSHSSLPSITIETDVGCAALGHKFAVFSNGGKWKQDVSFNHDGRDQVIAYVKVSMGIGGAIVSDVEPSIGTYHSEIGQVYVPRWQKHQRLDLGDPWRVSDPATIESCASLAALERVADAPFDTVCEKVGHFVWDRQAHYLAHLCWVITAVSAPNQIVLGGRVMSVKGLLDKTRKAFDELVNRASYPEEGYAASQKYIIPDRYGPNEEPGKPGVLGALILAAFRKRTTRWRRANP
ncbi:ROK family protein [Roseobacter sp. EG26]|uniref:ROK family protein n=1 Tax=Roseobacter sp. EG26 TaxID=3412477 RepID=UPI003CE56E95